MEKKKLKLFKGEFNLTYEPVNVIGRLGGHEDIADMTAVERAEYEEDLGHRTKHPDESDSGQWTVIDETGVFAYRKFPFFNTKGEADKWIAVFVRRFQTHVKLKQGGHKVGEHSLESLLRELQAAYQLRSIIRSYLSKV